MSERTAVEIAEALSARVSAIEADIARHPNITLTGIARRVEHDIELMRLVWAVRGRRCQFCRPKPGMHASKLFLFRRGTGSIGENLLIVCANHERLLLEQPVKILRRNANTLTVQIEEGVHTVSTSLLPRASSDDPGA
jgi:hypothetical protein